MDMFDKISGVKIERVKASPLQISTMTLSGRFDIKDIPIRFIRDTFEEDADKNDLRLASPKVPKRCGDGKQSNMKRFDHQISFKLGKSSLKIFSNGSVHGTGFVSVTDFVEMTEMVAEYISNVAGVQVHLMEVSLNMINASTSIMNFENKPITFRMKQLTDTFKKKGYKSDFDPEKHPAMKTILYEGDKKVCTSFVFPTGSVTIFGSREPKYVANMFAILFETMDEIYDYARPCDHRKTTLKKSLDVSYGYTTNTVKLLTPFINI